MKKIIPLILYLILCAFCFFPIYQSINALVILKDISSNKEVIKATVIEKLKYSSKCELNMNLAGTGDKDYLVQINFPKGVVVKQPLCSRYNYQVNDEVPFFYSSINPSHKISAEWYRYGLFFYSFVFIFSCFILLIGFVVLRKKLKINTPRG